MTGPRRKNPDATPRQYPSDTRRPTMTFRVRPDMVDKLKASAEERDLSASEEVERRVKLSFDFTRDAHDELVMRSIKTAFDIAEKVAGARWFEKKDAAYLCHAAIVKAADLLILGLGLGDEAALNGAVDQTAIAISSMAVNQTAGFGTTEAKRRYEEAVASYKYFDREHYIITKTLSEEGLPLDWATRPVTPEELAAFQGGNTTPVPAAETEPAEQSAPAPRKRPRAKVEAVDE